MLQTGGVARAVRGPRGVRAAVAGFTLIELMVVVAVVAILAAIAVPSYQNAVRKGKRGQVKADMVELAQLAERWRTNNNTYTGWDESLDDEQLRSPRVGEHTAYGIEADVTDGGQGFTLTSTPEGAQEKDTLCGTLTIDHAGRKTASGTADDVAECW